MHTTKVTTKKLKDGLQVECNAHNLKIILDEPEADGGTDIGMNPVESMMSALGACQTVVAAMLAEFQDFKFEEMHMELEGDIIDSDDDEYYEEGSRVSEIRYSIHFKTDEPQEKAEKFAELIGSQCTVGNSLIKGIKLVRMGVVID